MFNLDGGYDYNFPLCYEYNFSLPLEKCNT